MSLSLSGAARQTGQHELKPDDARI